MTARLKIGCAISGLLFFVILPVPAAMFDALELIQLLKTKNYPALEAVLERYQVAYERGPQNEEALEIAYGVFESSDPALKESLDAWVRARPDSYAARLARGIYHNHLGWLSRGSRFIRDTASDQISGMQRHFALAQEDIRAAVASNPKLSVGYGYLIQMEMATGDRSLRKLLDEALAANPYSFCVHRRYMYGLTPKWGGSLRAMRWYARETKTRVANNPKLSVLRGYIPFAQADALDDERDYDGALNKYTEALEHGEYWLFFKARGRNYYHKRDYVNALADFGKALTLRPTDAETFTYRGKTYYALKRYQEALADLNRAITLDPLVSDSLVARAKTYRQLDMPSEAEKDYENALTYGKHSAYVWKNKGWFHYYSQKNYRQAAIDLARAIELDADDSEALRLLGSSYYYLKDRQAIEIFERYLTACEQTADCEEKNLKWAKGFVGCMRGTSPCR